MKDRADENSGRQPVLARGALQQSIFFISWPFFMLGLLLPVYGRGIGAEVVEK